MSSTGPKSQTQKSSGSDNVASHVKSSSRATGSVTGKHVDAAAASASLDAAMKSSNNPVGLVPALGHLKPEDLFCVDKPETLNFGLPYIPPVKILGFEPHSENPETIAGLNFANTAIPPMTGKIIQSDANVILADILEDKISPSTGYSLPSPAYIASHSSKPLTLTEVMHGVPVSTLHQADLTLISSRPALLEHTSANKFQLTDRDHSFQEAVYPGDELMLADTRPATCDRRPTPDSRKTDAKSTFPNAILPFVNFTLTGTEPAFLDQSFLDTAVTSSRPDSTDKACHDTGLGLQSRAGLIETTSPKMSTSGVDETQTPKPLTADQGAEFFAHDATTTGQKNEPDQCLGFERKHPSRQFHHCNDCSEEEKMLMAIYKFSQEQLAELKESYLYFASPGDQLHETNFGRSLRAIGQNPSEEDIMKMLTVTSVRPNDGYITLDNYLKAVGCWGLRSDVDMVEDLIQAFKVFDEVDDGRLDFVKIRAALQNYAEPLDEQDVNRLLQLAESTPSGDGKLAFMSIIQAIAAHYITQDERII